MSSASPSSPALAKHITPRNNDGTRISKTKQYNDETEDFSLWLISKAEGLPDVADLLAPHLREDGTQAHALQLKNFEPLCKKLVSQSDFWVPDDVWNLPFSIAKLRNECNHMCERDGIGTAEDRERHKHPVRVFTEVGEILRPKLRVEPLIPIPEPDTLCLPALAVGRTRSEQESIDAAWPELPGKH